MGKHLNPLEKEFLICQYKRNTQIKLSDFCSANSISDAAFRKWIKCSTEAFILLRDELK